MAIVSGAAGGLGAPIVERLAADGFAVADVRSVAGRTGSALHVELDVTDAPAVAAFAARVENELGPVGVVVTAAGIQRTGASEAVSEMDWRRVIDVNLTGTWNVDPGDARGDARAR